MSLWLAIGSITLLVVAAMLLPLLRGRRAVAPRAAHDMEIHRDQLREVERDVGRGLLGEDDAAAARLEIQRRLLASDAELSAANDSGQRQTPRLAVALLAIIVPAAALTFYLARGNPGLPGQPFAERGGGGSEMAATNPDTAAGESDIGSVLAGLAERLRSNPDDLRGWTLLGRGYTEIGRFDLAVDAFARAVELAPGDAVIRAVYAESLINAGDGRVGVLAREALDAALAADPNEPRARFYLGVALDQAGRSQAALDAWIGLIEDSPADAPWLVTVRDHVTQLARQIGQDPAKILPAAPNPPSTGMAQSEIAAVTDTNPEQLAENAQALAARLEAEPGDWRGWLQLARSRAALEDREGAREALKRAAERFAGAPFVMQQIAAVAAKIGLDAPAGAPAQMAEGDAPGPSAAQIAAAQDMDPEAQAAMIRSMVERLANRLEDEPDDAEGWGMLGRSYDVLGESAKSADAFARRAALLPDDLGAQVDHGVAQARLLPAGAPLPGAIVETMQKVLALDPDQADALFFVGEAARQAGEPAEAARHWRRLLSILPPGSPEYVEIQDRLAALDIAG